MTKAAKKKTNNIIIMAVLVVVLVAAFIIIKLVNREQAVEVEDFSYPITSLKSGQIESVVYDYRDGSHAYIKNVDGTWYNGDDMDFPFSSSGFDSQFVEKFVAITATKKITEYEGGLEALGLDNPELTVSVTGKNSVTTTYKMGNYNPTMGLYYIMINDDEESIYMVADDLAYICRADIYDYASIDSFPVYSTDTLDFIEFKSGTSTSKLYYKEESSKEDITGYEWNWFFGEPFTRLMPCESSKMETLQEDTLQKLSYSKTVNYKATEEDMAEYGLDNPRGSYTINCYVKDEEGNITENKASITVYIGNLNSEEGGYYTREIKTIGLTQEKSNVVRIMESAGAEAVLGINPLEYILQNVLFLSINDIDGTSITFNNGQKDYVFSYESGDADNKDDDVYKQGDREVDDKKFRDLWYQMTCIAPERILTEKVSTSDMEAVYTIFADRNKEDYYGDITVRFIKYDATYYQVEINGVTDMVMRKKEVDDFFKALTEFAEDNLQN